MPSFPSASRRRAVDYDPRRYGYGVVPYITAWSEEKARVHPPVVIRPDGGGIGYATETLGDRDLRGVLWHRVAYRLGEGKPLFGNVHSTRQRTAMRHLLCQVCARPADENRKGVLWLLPDLRTQVPTWPDWIDVTEPPICRPCVELSTRLCPRLRRSHTLFRARTHDVTGAWGSRYLPTRPTPTHIGDDYAYFTEPVIRWTRARHLTRTLRKCTISRM